MQNWEGYQKLVLEAVPQLEGQIRSIEVLSGGITNSNFKIETEAQDYVIRLYGVGTEELGIRRDHEIQCHDLAASQGIAPPLFKDLSSARALVSQFIVGQTLNETSATSASNLPLIAQTIKRYHQGPAFPGTFSPFQTVRNYCERSLKKKVSFPKTLDSVLSDMERIESSIAPYAENKPCHNDLLAANFLMSSGKLWILDWEYAGMGDPFFDLGNFAVNQGLNKEQKAELLRHYYGESSSWHLAYLDLMLLASDLREAFWGFLQSAVSKIDFDYRAYALKHYERFREKAQPDFLRQATEILKEGHTNGT